jgi:purine-cytosine permease-like protein
VKPFWRNLVAAAAAVVVMNIGAPLAIRWVQPFDLPPEQVVFGGYGIAIVAASLVYLLVLKLVPLTSKPAVT